VAVWAGVSDRVCESVTDCVSVPDTDSDGVKVGDCDIERERDGV